MAILFDQDPIWTMEQPNSNLHHRPHCNNNNNNTNNNNNNNNNIKRPPDHRSMAMHCSALLMFPPRSAENVVQMPMLPMQAPGLMGKSSASRALVTNAIRSA